VSSDDEIFLYDAEPEQTAYRFADEDYLAHRWKVMIVDDEKSVHQATKRVLSDFHFEGKKLKIISAFSKSEAKALMRQHPDTAIILLDVMMDGEKAGLEIASFIRDELKNKYVRIILRTGQPHEAPEAAVIREYDINDYKEKTELTADKLHTTIVSALRSYRDIMLIESNKQALEIVLISSATLIEAPSMRKLATRVLSEIIAILHLNPTKTRTNIAGFIASKNSDGKYYAIAATPEYNTVLDQPVSDILPPADREQMGGQKENTYINHFRSKHGHEILICLKHLDAIVDWEKKLVAILMTNVTIAADNLYLHSEIEETQKEIIFTLGEFSEARSKETSNHVKRVAEYSKLLALKYGLTEEEAEIIRLASPMHDVGKLGITDTILNKPDKLSPEEFEIIKSHGTLGYEILKNSSRRILQAGAIIALQHHERFDGTGYPHGLQKDSIHIYGRITAIADVFDALGSDRVYKKAWPLEQILAYFKKEQGSHFDPTLVEIFFAHLPEFLQIRDELNDRFCFSA